ncbi:MAG: hypothetical protein HYS52_00380 [Candidatus Wildermuthbacteria bacterium]|nr:hypothetical protein [Candidatus Wildermuthbacteria bacterium]
MPRPDITAPLLKKLYWTEALSQKEMALQLHCNFTTIHKKMKRFGISTRKQAHAVKIAMQKYIITIPKSQLEYLYLRKKCSLPQIAKNLDRDISIVKREIVRNKIPLRTRSEALRLYGQKQKIKKSVLRKLYYEYKLTQVEIAKKLGRSGSHILRLMKEYGLPTRRPAYYHTKYQKHDFDGTPEEKAYLIGFRLGDLHVKIDPGKHTLRIDCTSTKKEQVALFRKLFARYGHIWIGKPRKDGNQIFVVHVNRTFDFLLPKKDAVSPWILKNSSHFFAFVGGYTDAEGCFWTDHRQTRFILASYDTKILHCIYRHFLKLGIPCNAPRLLVRKGFVKRDGLIYGNNHWSFTISKQSTLLHLFRVLKPKLKHKKRLRDLKKVESKLVKRWMNQNSLRRSSFRNLPV